ncbi:LysR family transcriptional regulator [Escherichia coli]|uniref:LysR family transcriptional regulator n=1 Tax=Escherichia coli TaxID=562 RepID=A0A376U7S8_ECOLX|nr:LysR family transcriptional regulator [Escherichia coli]
MNFQQLKIIREAARQDYNLTEVANMLLPHSQGVSRHIRELEDELGIEIFVRRGKRLLGMTEPGKALLVIAERILNEASNVRRLADLFTNDTSGVSLLQRRILRHVIACQRSLKLFANFSRRFRARANPGDATGNLRTLLQNGEADNWYRQRAFE